MRNTEESERSPLKFWGRFVLVFQNSFSRWKLTLTWTQMCFRKDLFFQGHFFLQGELALSVTAWLKADICPFSIADSEGCLYPDRAVWVTLTHKEEPGVSSFPRCIEKPCSLLETLSLISMVYDWAFRHSHHFFLLWSLLTNQKLYSHPTSPFAWNFYHSPWLCPRLQCIIGSVRYIADYSALSDCKPKSWTISPVIF